MLGKDGSLIAGWFFRGPDAAGMTASERNYLTARVNAVLARLGSEWAVWFDAVRMPAASYPDPSRSHFPDPVSRLIDEERREKFLAEAAHFETEHALILMYTPPLRRQARIIDYIYDDDGEREQIPPADRQIAGFKRALSDIEDALADLLDLRRMGAFEFTDEFGCEHLQDELVTYLQFCLTGELGGLNIPPCAMYLDAIIGGQELWAGDTPRIGERFISCLAIEGFPHESFPLMLSVLDDLAVAYRFSTRFMPLDLHEALGELVPLPAQMDPAQTRLLGADLPYPGAAMSMRMRSLMEARDRAAPSATRNSTLVTYGYYTPVIVLMGQDRSELAEQARGDCPADPRPRLCLPPRDRQHHGSLARIAARPYPPQCPPAADPFAEPRRSGAAHRQMAGLGRESQPAVSAGLAAAAACRDDGRNAVPAQSACRRCRPHPDLRPDRRRQIGAAGDDRGAVPALSEGARITAFDKGRSIFALASACGGAHYDLAATRPRPACVLWRCSTPAPMSPGPRIGSPPAMNCKPADRPSPGQRREIHRAIDLMRKAPDGGRTLTDFLATVQDADIRAALGAYTIEGALGRLLDARQDELADSPFTVFELDELMGFGEDKAIPVLTYLFRRIERVADGAPALLMLDEAWMMLGHPVFREKIREWLKTLRKANCAVVMATQSLSDAVRSGLLDVLLGILPDQDPAAE